MASDNVRGFFRGLSAGIGAAEKWKRPDETAKVKASKEKSAPVKNASASEPKTVKAPEAPGAAEEERY